MPLNSIPPTTTVAASRGQARGRAARRCSSTSASGAGPCRATSTTSRPLHAAGVSSASSASCSTRGSTEFAPLDARRARRRRCTETARSRRAAARARRGRDRDRGGAGRVGAVVRRLPGLAPAAAEERRDRPGRRRPRRHSGGRPHIVHLSDADALPLLRQARADGVRRHRRDLPALPDLRRRGGPRRRHRAQVLPADPRGRQPRRALGGAGRRHHRPRRHRPLAVHGRPQARRHRRLRRRLGWHRLAWSSACRRCGPQARGRGHTLVDVVAVDGRGARPTWSGSPARAGSPSARPPTCARSPRERAVVVDPARLHHKNPVTAVRRAYAHRHGPPHLAARRTRRPRGSAARPAAEEGRRMNDYYVPDRRAPGQTELTHRPGRLHHGVRRPPARHPARHHRQPAAALGRHPAVGAGPAAVRLRRDLQPVRRRGGPRRRLRPARGRPRRRGRALRGRRVAHAHPRRDRARPGPRLLRLPAARSRLDAAQRRHRRRRRSTGSASATPPSTASRCRRRS